ncbi:hypothetical protein [Microseira wollei]|nr:hypothetical protein [Microseira wollei]
MSVESPVIKSHHVAAQIPPCRGTASLSYLYLPKYLACRAPTSH